MRINIGIDPYYLTDEHLLAEYREIPMLVKWISKVYEKNDISVIPDKAPKEFSFGKGYFHYFLNKVGYLKVRLENVYKECKQRGFNVGDINQFWDLEASIFRFKHIGEHLNIEPYEPMVITTNRIKEKIKSSPKQYFHFYHQRINKQQAIDKLNENLKIFEAKSLCQEDGQIFQLIPTNLRWACWKKCDYTKFQHQKTGIVCGKCRGSFYAKALNKQFFLLNKI